MIRSRHSGEKCCESDYRHTRKSPTGRTHETPIGSQVCGPLLPEGETRPPAPPIATIRHYPEPDMFKAFPRDALRTASRRRCDFPSPSHNVQVFGLASMIRDELQGKWTLPQIGWSFCVNTESLTEFEPRESSLISLTLALDSTIAQ
jgi:hypothetical protein